MALNFRATFRSEAVMRTKSRLMSIRNNPPGFCPISQATGSRRSTSSNEPEVAPPQAAAYNRDSAIPNEPKKIGPTQSVARTHSRTKMRHPIFEKLCNSQNQSDLVPCDKHIELSQDASPSSVCRP